MMNSYDFMKLAKYKIADYMDDRLNHFDPLFRIEDVHTVWQCKTLQNHKGVFCTLAPDMLLFEVTYNGDKNEMYLDVYDKILNKRFVLSEGSDEHTEAQ